MCCGPRAKPGRKMAQTQALAEWGGLTYQWGGRTAGGVRRTLTMLAGRTIVAGRAMAAWTWIAVGFKKPREEDNDLLEKHHQRFGHRSAGAVCVHRRPQPGGPAQAER